MKQLLIILLLISVQVVAQDSTTVQLISRSLPDKVMLRWAVDEPNGWKMANELGFMVERSTISRNGEAVVPIERKLLTPSPLKPKPLEEWETLAKQDQNAAILAQALYGDSFETITPNPGVLGEVTAVNEELEQRFTFALVAAEQSFSAALLAGWGLTDTTVLPGEHYVYKVSVALPINSTQTIKEGLTYAATELHEELPEPIGLAGVFKDSHVLLSWNYNLLGNLYTNYVVEKSTDGNSFKQQNKQPIFNASQENATGNLSLYYTDSIPNNLQLYYRVRGKTAFGEIGPPSSVVQGEGKKALEFVPRIYKKEIPTDHKAVLYWEFKEEGDSLITNFQLNRGNTNEGPFETVIDNIPKDQRQISFNKLERINYFTISAVDKEGVKSESLPVIVQPVDSIPPAIPTNLAGTIDTTGIVKLKWLNNQEVDLAGYRIFRSHNLDTEFTEVTSETWPFNEYLDTLQIKNLNQKIYYKIKAEDQRFNQSKFSKVTTIAKPDMVAPSSPVFKKYLVTDKGVELSWVPSSSTDVAEHQLYRKPANTVEENSWEKIFNGKDSLFIDDKILNATVYQYTLIALDSNGLESMPSKPVIVKWGGGNIDSDDIKFTGIANRELRYINLSWRVKNHEVTEYRLYRKSGNEAFKLYRTFNGETNGFNDVNLMINSTYEYGLQTLLSNGELSILKKFDLRY